MADESAKIGKIIWIYFELHIGICTNACGNMYWKLSSYEAMMEEANVSIQLSGKGTETGFVQLWGDQMKGKIAAYTGNLPAWQHLKRLTCNSQLREKEAQECSKSKSSRHGGDFSHKPPIGDGRMLCIRALRAPNPIGRLS
jgi:hypothetical protein